MPLTPSGPAVHVSLPFSYQPSKSCRRVRAGLLESAGRKKRWGRPSLREQGDLASSGVGGAFQYPGSSAATNTRTSLWPEVLAVCRGWGEAGVKAEKRQWAPGLCSAEDSWMVQVSRAGHAGSVCGSTMIRASFLSWGLWDRQHQALITAGA